MPAANSRPNPATDFLRETALIDFSHPRLQQCALRLAGPGHCARDRALAIHSFVRLIPFSADPPSARQAPASQVLHGKRGDALSKGVLFVALCRAAGVPARLRCLRLESDPFRALRGGHEGSLAHPIAQVLLDGRWLSTDAHLLDPVLFAVARRRQTQEGLDDWGLRPDAPALWEGRDDCLQWCSPADVLNPPDSGPEPAVIESHAPRVAAGSLLAQMCARMRAQLRALVRPCAGLDRHLRRLREAPPPRARRSSPA